jgi:hypothetical protein
MPKGFPVIERVNAPSLLHLPGGYKGVMDTFSTHMHDPHQIKLAPRLLQMTTMICGTYLTFWIAGEDSQICG